MKRYALLKPIPGSTGFRADLDDTYSQDEAAEMINKAYWSLNLPPPVVPHFLEIEVDDAETPSLHAYLLSVSDE